MLFVAGVFCAMASPLHAFTGADKGDKNSTAHYPQFGATATFAPGFMRNQEPLSFYLHGQAFVFIDKRVSLRGDAFMMLPSSNDGHIFDMHHTFSAGPSLHFTHGQAVDPYIGFGVGFSYSQLKPTLISYETAPAVNPLFMPHIGCRVFAEQWFYFFAEANYNLGKHFPENHPAVSFSELRISAGLGFQFSKMKAKPKTL
ncbi:MAG: hypothetical protein MUC87_12425 [Bacteroidia bacterium]|jgi:hypothetical protein|nr:hypothetical protein [Bacteroidia bacterium]